MSALRFDLHRTLKWAVPLTRLFMLGQVVLIAYSIWALLYFRKAIAAEAPTPELMAEGVRINEIGLYVGGAMIAVTLLTHATNAVWIYRTSWNARELQPDPERIRPAWAVLWFFVPLPNLWMPYRALRQAWNSLENPTGDIDREAPIEVRPWWLSWLFAGLLSLFVIATLAVAQGNEGFARAATFMIGSAFLYFICARLFVRTMRHLTALQPEGVPEGVAA